MKNIFIAVEGPIGVGKSTLAKAVSAHFQFHLLNEIVDENPYLAKFYKNIDKWAFQTEMFFLVNRFNQLEEISDRFLAKQIPVVSDYHMFKNLIFAKQNLTDAHFKKYQQIFSILNEDLPQPNLIIYLHADVEILLKRIAKRGRDFEKNMDPGYLKKLIVDYDAYVNQFMKDYPHIPVLSIDGNTTDFVENKDDLQTILQQIESWMDKRRLNQ